MAWAMHCGHFQVESNWQSNIFSGSSVFCIHITIQSFSLVIFFFRIKIVKSIFYVFSKIAVAANPFLTTTLIAKLKKKKNPSNGQFANKNKTFTRFLRPRHLTPPIPKIRLATKIADLHLFLPVGCR